MVRSSSHVSARWIIEKLSPTVVFETYWHFAVERQLVYFRRFRNDRVVTLDPILKDYRFTNVYRASDRTSQYLISRVQPLSTSTEDAIFRTLLFKVFNKIETWKLLEENLGESPSVSSFSAKKYAKVLGAAVQNGSPIYSNAYIMPNPNLGWDRKYLNHLALIEDLIRTRMLRTIAKSKSLKDLYAELIKCNSFGKFLAFQYAIDINYFDSMCFDEMSFVVAGPGALGGIRKCFRNWTILPPEEIIRKVCESSHEVFGAMGLRFESLWGRPLQLIDCQNLFCEVDKYARLAHPEYNAGGRFRIKQGFVPRSEPLMSATFPKSWGLAKQTIPAVPSVGEIDYICGRNELPV